MGDEDIPEPPSTTEPISPPRVGGPGLGMDSSDTEDGDPADERKQIKALNRFEIQVGGKYNLIDASWWRSWKDWTCFDDKQYDELNENGEESKSTSTSPPTMIISKGPRPPQIDNSSLLVSGSQSRLSSLIREQEHYEFITPQAWSLFIKWYGGGPNIVRRGITESRNSRKAIVELHGVNIKVMLSNNKDDVKDMNVSKAGTVRELKETIMNDFNIKGQDVRLWDYFRSAPFALLDVPSSTLGDANIIENQEILVEISDEDGLFHIKKPASNTYGNNDRSGALLENQVVSNHSPEEIGVCGLSNLGNTCFMNSTLQCLSNTPPLRHYFSGGDFKNDINRGNPLGHEGKLAESFGHLMQLMWDPKQPAGVVSPKGFKYQMGRFRPEFQGFQQHDSSELMNFLLDGLHEDLNRIIDKPYTEAVENDGTKPDEEMSQIFLEQHMKRNDSFIHDLFRGQFKSTLVCPCCGNVSVTFDPYTMVSLPLTTLAQERMSSFNVTVWSRTKDNSEAGNSDKNHEIFTCGRTKQNIKVLVPKGAKAQALIEAVAESTGIDIHRLVITQIMRGYVYKVFDDEASLEYLNNFSKIVAHEVEEGKAFSHMERPSYMYGRSPTPQYESPNAAVTCLFRVQHEETYNYYVSTRTRTISTLFGAPLLLNHPKETNPKALYEAVAHAISTMVTDASGVPQQLIFAKHIKIYVSKDMYASQSKVDQHPVDRNDDKAIDQGMHAKLTLVVEFEDEVLDILKRHSNTSESGGGSLKLPGIPLQSMSSDDDKKDDKKAEDDDSEEEEEETSSENAMKIEECFDLFETPETLSVEDSWYCNKCKDHVQATKQMELWSTPDVLVLHLKRFSYSRWSRDKLETAVSFPLDNFDMSRFTKGPEVTKGDSIYDCVAVSNHMGSLGGGHYTASARGADNKWYTNNLFVYPYIILYVLISIRDSIKNRLLLLKSHMRD
mmetsp:Transcript_26361/g.34274  ORF Transcript_26361/g.34274 Transcript_26361/m.34274 type:complete len:950 (+) Transcript_26361:95-2944(+)